MGPILRGEDDIVRDSIIKNKERTKSYWEQLMITAATDNNKSITKRQDSESSLPGSSAHSNRNSICSLDTSDEIKEVETELRNVKEEKKRIEREIRLRAERDGPEQDGYPVRMQDKIAMELQDMRQREEELRILRQQMVLSTTEETMKKEDGDAITNVEVNSQDGSTYSEYGSEEKEPSLDGSGKDTSGSNFMRTHSMESVSSGLSSAGSGLEREAILPRRRQHVTVRPFEDPDEITPAAFKSVNKETPIEREIRTVREREDELRKAKGMSDEKPLDNVTKKLILGRSKDAVENDTRGVQQRIATNRIQQEIEETSEREIQLRTEGKILTISQETVDAKVTRFTQLAEHAIQEGQSKNRKMKRSSSINTLTALNDSELNSTFNRQASQDSQRKFLNNTNSQRGIMERFIATKGRLSTATSIPTKYMTLGHNPASPNIDLSPPVAAPRNVVIPIILTSEEPPVPVIPTRNGFRSAEEKIQAELQEMRKREEELRLQRAHSMAQSQPNLLDIDDDPEEVNLSSWRSHECQALSASNPNLLEASNEVHKVVLKGYKKRFSLLEQWENRIQNQDV